MGPTNFYAHVIHDGKTTELAVASDGILKASWEGLKGTLISNATEVYCSNNSLTSLELPNATGVYCHNNSLTLLELPNAKKVICRHNSLTSLSLPNATWVDCSGNFLTSLSLPSAKRVICRNNSLTSLELPNATGVYCEDNSLTSLELPNATRVDCHNNSLTALVKDCGSSSRQIWSQKIGDTIYTYIGCGRFTLDEAIEAINKKYSGAKAEEYIAKVKQSQEAVTN